MTTHNRQKSTHQGKVYKAETTQAKRNFTMQLFWQSNNWKEKQCVATNFRFQLLP